MVTARHSEKIIDIAAASRDPGARLQQWQVVANQPNQRFRFERLNDGFHLIRVMHTNLVLDVDRGLSDSGAVIVQWPWHGGDNQRFALDDGGDGFFRIRAKHSGKVLDVSGASKNKGAAIFQWDATGGTNQLWRHSVAID